MQGAPDEQHQNPSSADLYDLVEPDELLQPILRTALGKNVKYVIVPNQPIIISDEKEAGGSGEYIRQVFITQNNQGLWERRTTTSNGQSYGKKKYVNYTTVAMANMERTLSPSSLRTNHGVNALLQESYQVTRKRTTILHRDGLALLMHTAPGIPFIDFIRNNHIANLSAQQIFGVILAILMDYKFNVIDCHKIHRDLKPDNIMIEVVTPEILTNLERRIQKWTQAEPSEKRDEKLRQLYHQQQMAELTGFIVTIIDWEAAVYLPVNETVYSENAAAVGTFAYLTPTLSDSMTRLRHYSIHTDIYALGLTIFQFFSGYDIPADINIIFEALENPDFGGSHLFPEQRKFLADFLQKTLDQDISDEQRCLDFNKMFDAFAEIDNVLFFIETGNIDSILTTVDSNTTDPLRQKVIDKILAYRNNIVITQNRTPTAEEYQWLSQMLSNLRQLSANPLKHALENNIHKYETKIQQEPEIKEHQQMIAHLRELHATPTTVDIEKNISDNKKTLDTIMNMKITPERAELACKVSDYHDTINTASSHLISQKQEMVSRLEDMNDNENTLNWTTKYVALRETESAIRVARCNFLYTATEQVRTLGGPNPCKPTVQQITDARAVINTAQTTCTDTSLAANERHIINNEKTKNHDNNWRYLGIFIANTLLAATIIGPYIRFAVYKSWSCAFFSSSNYTQRIASKVEDTLRKTMGMAAAAA